MTYNEKWEIHIGTIKYNTKWPKPLQDKETNQDSEAGDPVAWRRCAARIEDELDVWLVVDGLSCGWLDLDGLGGCGGRSR